MTGSDASAGRDLLQSWGRGEHPPGKALAALTLINVAGTAALALSLAALLTRFHSPLAIAGIGAALAVRAVSAWLSARIAARHARRVVSRLRRDLVAGALERRRGEGPPIGALMSAVVDEAEALDGYYGRFRPAAAEARLAPLAIAAVAALASPVSAAILVATLAPFAVVMAVAGGAAASESARQFEALARLSGRFVDRVRALPVILAFQAEGRETQEVARAAQDVSRRTLAVLKIAFVSTAALELFAAVSVALVAVYGGFALLGLLPFKAPEHLDFGRAFFALALAPEFYAPMRRLAGAYHEKQLGEAAAGRLAGLAAKAPPAAPAPSPACEARSPPTVGVAALRLRVGDVAIGPLSLTAEPRTITAIVGPTGAGKSSFLAAVLGQAPIEAGAIEIDGRRCDDYRAVVAMSAWAGQAPVFVPGTIAENLMAAAPGVGREAAQAMTTAVGLEPALARRPLGLDTTLDERGSGLSGGERRRLALARALLTPAPLLLLDEPTADLDARAEAEVTALIRQAAATRTVIVATHSERLAAAADQVVRLP